MLTMGTKPAPKTVRGLVLAPTRELANQIQVQLRALTENTQLKTNLVVGGMSIKAQINRLERGTDLLVATPGRLIDLMDRRALDLSETSFLVLDEADQMLDLGFIHALRRISSMLPEQRQTMLFSATMPKQMNEIANTYLKSPIRIEVSPPGKVADKVTQEIHFIAKAQKGALLLELLDKHRDERALVFGRTKHGMEKLSKTLEKAGYKAGSIHGNKSQGQRDRAIAAFKAGTIKVLVATDVAARGLDIPDVKHVYNYELPNVPDNYVHRIGRTARAGKEGAAIAFCAPDEMKELKDIQKTMGMKIPIASGRMWEPSEEEKPKQRGRGGRPGGGGGGRPGGGRPGGGRPAGGGAPGGGGKPGGQRRRRPAKSA
jgi:ATP-dependent RNA helicase RhlE